MSHTLWTRTAMRLALGLSIALLVVTPTVAVPPGGPIGTGDGPKTTVTVQYQGATVYNSTRWAPLPGTTNPVPPEFQAVADIVLPIASEFAQLQHELSIQWRNFVSDSAGGLSHWVTAPRFTLLPNVPTTPLIGDISKGELKLSFASAGSGQLQLLVTVPGLTASAGIDEWPIVTGQADVTVSQWTVAGTYDLLTGQFVLSAPQLPVITVDTHAGGILNIISFGLLDAKAHDLGDDLQEKAQEAINQLLLAKLAQYSTTVFGIEQFLPTNLSYGGTDVDQVIRNFVTNVPAGDLLDVYFVRKVHLVGLEAGGTIHVKIGNIATLSLSYNNPVPQCYTPPGQPPPTTCPLS